MQGETSQTPRPHRRPISLADAGYLGLEQARRDFAHRSQIGPIRTAFRRLVAIVTADDRPEHSGALTRQAVRQGR